MEKRMAHLFRCFGTFVLVLYSVGVSSIPTPPQNIIDVMRNDAELSKLPTFFYESNIIKTCANLSYPKDDTTLEYANMNTFLCLGVYDALYKICNYSRRWEMPFNSSVSFDSYIKGFIPVDTTNDADKFCPMISNVTPMYEKTKPFVSTLFKHLYNQNKCSSFCYTLSNEFQPLCAVLAWIKDVDVQMKAVAIRQKTTKQSVSDKDTDVAMVEPKNNSPNSAKPVSHATLGSSSNITPKLTSTSSLSNSEKTPKTQDNDNTLQKVLPDPGKTANEQSQAPNIPSNVEERVEIKEDSTNNAAPPINNIGQVEPETSQNSPSKETQNEPKKIEKVSIQEPDGSGLNNVKPSEQDPKTSTISQHTADEPTNQEDYNRSEDEPLPYENPGDSPDQSLNTGDQNQNIPEPSEQRDVLPRYHNIGTDDDSHFFTYFTVVSLICVIMYIGYHNKQKILAIVLEGRRSRNNRGRRRPSTANYRKLDCTLEEAVTSQCNANVTHVIY